MVTGKLWSTQARFRCRPVAEPASAWVAVWSAKAKSRSAPPIAISKAAWAIRMRRSIWVRPPSWQPARWLDSFARRKHSQIAPPALPFAARKANPPSAVSVEIIAGFPPSVRGRVLFIDKDNLNTDGIYAGKHTYRDDITPEQMAAVTFENYDPNFNTLYQNGDVVVGGLNFGTGSSREQAATALKFKGIPCVIASSFSETYKRNAFNNGFVVFECPELVTHLRATLANRRADHGGPGNHNRLRQIHADDRRKIIFLSAAESGRPGIDRGRRRRESGGQAASRASALTPLERASCPPVLACHPRNLRFSTASSRLEALTIADKITTIWLNTKSRGCRVTESAMMSWRRRASSWIA